nr:type VI secretion system Vgr family protein [Duganella lactea]
MLLPQRVYGAETICGGIEYRVLCVSGNAQLPLKQLIAVSAVLELVTDQGDLRSVCGIVTEASSGDSDGGLASYQLVLRDALAILEKRSNTRVFRNMDEIEIVQRILNEWRHKSPVLGICFKHETDDAFHVRTYPKREFTMQHNESEAAFIRRLLKRRGIGWYIRADGDAHTLVLFNNADSLRRNAAGTIRYHRDSGTEERDTITAWSAVRSLQPGTVTRHSWDYMNPQGRDFMLVDARSGINQGVNGNELAATLDDYQILPPHAGDDHEDLFRFGQLRMSRHDYESKCFHGEGSVRDLCAGEYFTLAEHPEVDQHPPEERDFVVTALQVMAQNNLPKALAARVDGLFARSRWMHGAAEQQMQREVADKVARGPRLPLVLSNDQIALLGRAMKTDQILANLRKMRPGKHADYSTATAFEYAHRAREMWIAAGHVEDTELVLLVRAVFDTDGRLLHHVALDNVLAQTDPVLRRKDLHRIASTLLAER